MADREPDGYLAYTYRKALLPEGEIPGSRQLHETFQGGDLKQEKAAQGAALRLAKHRADHEAFGTNHREYIGVENRVVGEVQAFYGNGRTETAFMTVEFRATYLTEALNEKDFPVFASRLAVLNREHDVRRRD